MSPTPQADCPPATPVSRVDAHDLMDPEVPRSSASVVVDSDSASQSLSELTTDSSSASSSDEESDVDADVVRQVIADFVAAGVGPADDDASMFPSVL